MAGKIGYGQPPIRVNRALRSAPQCLDGLNRGIGQATPRVDGPPSGRTTLELHRPTTAVCQTYTGQGWARDGWLTNSHWNPMIDFMFHGRKEADKIQYKRGAHWIGFLRKMFRNLNGPMHFPWFDTLRTPVLLDQCATPPRWNHDQNLIVSPFKILQHLEGWRQKVNDEYQQMTQKLEHYEETFGTT
ncbi:hypothetical protein OSTOST_20136 [Ostertagia ostertagi]